MFKELSTQRTLLKKVTGEYTHDIFEYASDKETTQYMSWPTHKDVSDTEEFIRDTNKRYKSGSHYDWAIILKKDKKMIGTCGIPNLKVKENTAEIGYIINKKYWNRGYATEVVSRLLKFIFEDLNLQKAEAYCFMGNDASERVLHKAGFTFRGIKKYDIIKQKQPIKAKYFTLKKT